MSKEDKSIEQIAQADVQAAEMVSAALTVIPPSTKIIGTFGPIAQQIEKAAAKANAVHVVDVQDKATAEMYARLLHPVVSKLEKKRLQLTGEIKKRMIDPVNDVMKPVITAGQGAVNHLKSEIQAFERRLIEAQQAEQCKADAEAERRRKIQQAAIDRGCEPRQEIVAPVVAMPETVTDNQSAYWRITYEVTDESLVPRQFCRPDAGLIRSAVTEIEKGFDKDQRGMKEIPQTIPGVKISWQRHARLG